jgi:hypothetical protein
MEQNELSEIVRRLSEDPVLLERIRELSDKKENTEQTPREVNEAAAVSEEEIISAFTPKVGERRGRRGDLLSAMKPYLSPERQQAIDSMLTIADVIDMMRSK